MERHQDKALLKRFIDEQFDIESMFIVGFFSEKEFGDYDAMADRICEFFGYETVYEYGAKGIRCHLSYGDIDSSEGRPKEPFVTTIPSIYES